MNTCFNWVNTNLVLRIKKSASTFFGNTKSLSLTDFEGFMLLVLTTSTSSTLLSILPTPLMALSYFDKRHINGTTMLSSN